jgi:bifunctional DNA-binding transcriptional regulator/antitoxin component of YhaV-PrlF toxin-antitoxin module
MNATHDKPASLNKQETSETLEFTATVLSDGSLSIPKQLRQLMELKAGSKLFVCYQNGEASFMTPQERGRRVQESVQAYMKANNIPPAKDTGAERIRKMRDEDAAIEAKRGR